MDKLIKNNTYIAAITGYSSRGLGVCRVHGQAVFVRGALADEIWEIKIVKVSSSGNYAKGIRLMQPAASRTEVDCPYFGQCGGCDTRHMTYDEELRFKLDKVNSALSRIGKQSISAAHIVPADSALRYRNKGIYTVAQIDGRPRYGFYKERSHDLICVDDCLIQSELSTRCAEAVVDFMGKNGFTAFDESTGSGSVKHIFCRKAVNTGDAVLCIVSAAGFGSKTASLVEHIRDLCPELTGIVLNINRACSNTILTGDFYTLWGRDVINDTLCGLSFEIAPQAFFQINPPQAEKLYGLAVEYAVRTHDELILDMYCGAGTISLALAKKAKTVIGAEIVPPAIENAKNNAKNNNISNCSFICADAGEAAQALACKGLQPDAVVVDPPRKGMDTSAIDAIISMRPERVVYVSCNPSTLARDVLYFSEKGYTLSEATAVDMFPGTSHVETVVLLSQQRPNDKIRVELDLTEFDITAPEKEATYQEIKDFILEKHGTKVSSLYIALVKEKMEIKERENYNPPRSADTKQPKCPLEKEKLIIEALRHFQMI